MHRLMALPLPTLTCQGGQVADPREPHKAPNHISKTVPPTIHLGPPEKNRTVHREQRDTPICEYAFTDLA